MDSSLLDKIALMLQSSKRIVLAGHHQPDGDCIGSMVALALALEQKGVAVTLVNPDPVPDNYTFLARTDQFQQELTTECELLVVLDCSDWDRLYPLQASLQQCSTVINIDHHISNLAFANINLVDPSAGATGELIFELLERMRTAIRPEIATALYTAIVTDTGSFQHESTSSNTHEIAAHLLAAGADLAVIRANLWENTPLLVIKLIARVLSELEMAAEGKIAILSLTLATRRELGIDSRHTEGLVNFARAIAGVEVGLMLQETEPGKVKVALRTRKIDANLLADKFGGGGHRRAAGCTLEESLEVAKHKLVSAIKEELRQVSTEQGR